MDNSRIQSNYDQAYQPVETDNPRLEQLASTPGLIDPQSISAADDDGLRPEDVLSVDGVQALPPVLAVAPPEVGAPVARGAEDIVIPLDGRGAAVALQERLEGYLAQGNRAAFNDMSEALGVQNPEAFEAVVNAGSALQTFGQVDSNRVLFTDQNFNEIAPDTLSAVARAQMVIKPSYEAPIDPKAVAPEVVMMDPNRKVLDQLNTPLVQNAALMQDLIQRNPEQAQQSDSVAVG